MKRCSECDFIYEDDQNRCDMDGHELVDEPTLQSLPVNATTTQPAKARTRRLVFAVVVAIIVGALLSVGYSGLTRNDVPQTTKAPPTNVIRTPQTAPVQSPARITPTAPTAPTAPAANPTPSPSESPRLEKTRARPGAGSPLAESQQKVEPTTRGRESVKAEPVKANHKKDSRIGSFLKKTGKLLKKPFK
jgi:hypothetical protein